jgi:hypothetical protein
MHMHTHEVHTHAHKVDNQPHEAPTHRGEVHTCRMTSSLFLVMDPNAP